jgi:hypothetical protein
MVLHSDDMNLSKTCVVLHLIIHLSFLGPPLLAHSFTGTQKPKPYFELLGVANFDTRVENTLRNTISLPTTMVWVEFHTYYENSAALVVHRERAVLLFSWIMNVTVVLKLEEL